MTTQTTALPSKFRISKKSLSELPPAVAARIQELAADYRVKSFRYVTKSEGFRYIAGEGENISVIVGNQSRSVEMISENTLGASGLHHGIGDSIAPPAGTFIIVVSYYTQYWMTVYNIGHRQIG